MLVDPLLLPLLDSRGNVKARFLHRFSLHHLLYHVSLGHEICGPLLGLVTHAPRARARAPTGRSPPSLGPFEDDVRSTSSSYTACTHCRSRATYSYGASTTTRLGCVTTTCCAHSTPRRSPRRYPPSRTGGGGRGLGGRGVLSDDRRG